MWGNTAMKSPIGTGCLMLVAALLSPPHARAVDVWTAAVDNTREGWNRSKTILTSANVPRLRKMHEFAVDEKVDVSPLVVGTSRSGDIQSGGYFSGVIAGKTVTASEATQADAAIGIQFGDNARIGTFVHGEIATTNLLASEQLKDAEPELHATLGILDFGWIAYIH
jgi:hypothetical protein